MFRSRFVQRRGRDAGGRRLPAGGAGLTGRLPVAIRLPPRRKDRRTTTGLPGIREPHLGGGLGAGLSTFPGGRKVCRICKAWGGRNLCGGRIRRRHLAVGRRSFRCKTDVGAGRRGRGAGPFASGRLPDTAGVLRNQPDRFREGFRLLRGAFARSVCGRPGRRRACPGLRAPRARLHRIRSRMPRRVRSRVRSLARLLTRGKTGRRHPGAAVPCIFGQVRKDHFGTGAGTPLNRRRRTGLRLPGLRLTRALRRVLFRCGGILADRSAGRSRRSFRPPHNGVGSGGVTAPGPGRATVERGGGKGGKKRQGRGHRGGSGGRLRGRGIPVAGLCRGRRAGIQAFLPAIRRPLHSRQGRHGERPKKPASCRLLLPGALAGRRLRRACGGDQKLDCAGRSGHG